MALSRQQLTSTLLDFYHQPVAQVSLELFLSIMAVIFFGLFAIRPTLLTMSDLIKEIEDKRKIDAQFSQKIAALSTAQGEYLLLQDQLTLLNQALPSSPEFMYSIKLIEKTASERRLPITNLSVQEIPNEVPDGQDAPATKLERIMIPVSVGVTGEYPVIRSWLSDLNGLRRSIVVESVSFATNEERGTSQLKATINLSIPYLGVNTSTKTPNK
jgi:Tfp pilus assembly protein PilO